MTAPDIDLQLLDDGFVATEAIESFARRHASSGAIVSFIGKVRPGDGVEELELTDYYPLTRTSILDFARVAWQRWRFDGLLAWHRKGTLKPGEPIVVVAVAARHRREAFEATQFMMDHLKCAAWFWKRERRADGWHWISPTPADHAARARWGIIDAPSSQPSPYLGTEAG